MNPNVRRVELPSPEIPPIGAPRSKSVCDAAVTRSLRP